MLARAQLLEARGDLESALDDYEAAIARPATRCDPRRSAPRTSARAAASSRCAGSTRRRSTRRSRRALLARWGGTRVEELAVLRRRLGGGEPVEGPAELTPREREVAALLAEGLTNGELATRLFISPKTASVHVSNILAKLSMTSRAEIAAYAVRAGLADAGTT